MKKILSVMLAIMMLFGALSISASAANVPPSEVLNPVIASSDKVVIVFKFYGGTSKLELPVYYSDVADGSFVNEKVTGDYYLLPGAGGAELRIGTSITLPSVTPPEGKAFVGWDSSVDTQDFVAGATYEITQLRVETSKLYPNSGIIYMEAMYEAAEPEGDTMATVLSVLTKVFGTILGILFLDGNSAAGVELVEKLLGGIM